MVAGGSSASTTWVRVSVEESADASVALSVSPSVKKLTVVLWVSSVELVVLESLAETMLVIGPTVWLVNWLGRVDSWSVVVQSSVRGCSTSVQGVIGPLKSL